MSIATTLPRGGQTPSRTSLASSSTTSLTSHSISSVHADYSTVGPATTDTASVTDADSGNGSLHGDPTLHGSTRRAVIRSLNAEDPRSNGHAAPVMEDLATDASAAITPDAPAKVATTAHIFSMLTNPAPTTPAQPTPSLSPASWAASVGTTGTGDAGNTEWDDEAEVTAAGAAIAGMVESIRNRDGSNTVRLEEGARARAEDSDTDYEDDDTFEGGGDGRSIDGAAAASNAAAAPFGDHYGLGKISLSDEAVGAEATKQAAHRASTAADAEAQHASKSSIATEQKPLDLDAAEELLNHLSDYQKEEKRPNSSSTDQSAAPQTSASPTAPFEPVAQTSAGASFQPISQARTFSRQGAKGNRNNQSSTNLAGFSKFDGVATKKPAGRFWKATRLVQNALRWRSPDTNNDEAAPAATGGHLSGTSSSSPSTSPARANAEARAEQGRSPKPIAVERWKRAKSKVTAVVRLNRNRRWTFKFPWTKDADKDSGPDAGGNTTTSSDDSPARPSHRDRTKKKNVFKRRHRGKKSSKSFTGHRYSDALLQEIANEILEEVYAETIDVPSRLLATKLLQEHGATGNATVTADSSSSGGGGRGSDAGPASPGKKRRQLPNAKLLPGQTLLSPHGSRSSSAFGQQQPAALMSFEHAAFDRRGELFHFLNNYFSHSNATTAKYMHYFKTHADVLCDLLDHRGLERALHALTGGKITEHEIKYVLHVLEMMKGEGGDAAAAANAANDVTVVDFEQFTIIATLSEKVALLDDAVKDKMGTLSGSGLGMLHAKISWCRDLFFLNDPERTGYIPKEDLTIMMKAGRVDQESKDALMASIAAGSGGGGGAQDGGCIVNSVGDGGAEQLSFLDFLMYIPFFVDVHQEIKANPVTDEAREDIDAYDEEEFDRANGESAGNSDVGFGAIFAAKRLAKRLKQRISNASSMRQSLREQVERDKVVRGRTNVVKEGHALEMLKAHDAEDALQNANRDEPDDHSGDAENGDA